jgi:plastocyanin
VRGGREPRVGVLGMSGRFPWRAAVAFFAAASVILLGLGAVEANPVRPAAGSNALTVTVGDALMFTLSTDEITPGATIQLTVVQTSSTTGHTFTLSNVSGTTFPTSDTTADLLTFFAAHPPLVNISIPAGQGTHTYSFVAPPYGEYAYVCLIPGHFPSMYGILGSGEAGGTSAPYDGPGAAVFIIGGTIASLVVVALVLGFVIGRRRGSHDEMPPERLGYPETTPGTTPPPH